MTRNRVTVEAPAGEGSRIARGIGAVLTLVLLVPAAAVLTARARALIGIEQSGLPSCTGVDTVGPVLQAGLPVVFLLLVIPGALLSLGHRARGWIWLTLALAATVVVEVGLRIWLPACL
ncbi:hypothetical protein [Janibacter alittae]|uniref:DUF1634 domain-containing protein n=1 Tax=Janibacter alittae TaxID=3115209 RepID=A0ABZ2MK08_9MICO